MEWTANRVRQQFLDFFEGKGHAIVPSAPMVIKNDPTLMFTNAGMNQFKDVFLGNHDPKDTRVADTQKCLRVSGKHNDLEEVGVDTYHHTMFEMLGNWSFGDYFKKEAIEWAWELLTEVYKLDKDRLYITIFEGDKDDNLAEDTEAFEIWKNLISEDRILKANKKDNFWEMGNNGPCGPCSEIHYDMRSFEEREWRAGRELVNEDHPQVIEIWNLVFIQYNRRWNSPEAQKAWKQADDAARKQDNYSKVSASLLSEHTTLDSLPARHIDTGMGLERLVRALQAKQSNYDTDLFSPIIKAIESHTGVEYGGSDRPACVATRVMSDHIRAVAFAIADGQMPSNTGAGYVIRRILRRAVRYAFSFHNMREPFLYKLVDVLVAEMGNAFPELPAQADLAKKVIQEEENSFLRTLENGIDRFNNYLESKPARVDGNVAFDLYHTYGFPIDLTQLMARERGLDVDMDAFEAAMKEAKEESKKDADSQKGDWIVLLENEQEEFIGYDYTESKVKITRYREVNEKGKTFYHFVFNLTPFYAESGGQVGDTGYIEYVPEGQEGAGDKYSILDTQKENNLIIHIADKLPKNPHETFKAVVDSRKRHFTSNNHSATHLLHFTLREVLGTHVEQKGSLVNHKHLRFDFSHFQKVSEEELLKIEQRVNQLIRQNLELDEQRTVPFQAALDMGAMALFGEKYGDVVRVIRFGESVELCGGIHVPATGQIGLFKITSESSISAGIRRIEAITSVGAEQFVREQLDALHEIKALLKNPPNVSQAVQSLLQQNTDLKKKVEAANKAKAGNVKQDLMDSAEDVNGVRFIGQQVDLDPKSIKDLAFQLKSGENMCIVLGADNDGKASLTVALSDNLIAEKSLNAGQMIREIAKEIQGGGGGQPQIAQAGGKNPAGLAKAIDAAKALL